MKKILISLTAVLVIFIGFVSSGPYRTIEDIKTATAEKDVESLSRNIDFPVLKQNLKDQINSQMMDKLRVKDKESPFATFAIDLASNVIDEVIKAFVSPYGLEKMMQGKNPSYLESQLLKDESDHPTEQELFPDARYSYDSMSQCSVWIPNEYGGETGFILARDGISWKLVNIIMPM